MLDSTQLPASEAVSADATAAASDSSPAASPIRTEDHLGLVHHIARRFALRCPVPLEELVSAGMEGLVVAAATFKTGFGTFASWAAPQIRFAILSELRARDPLPQSLRRRVRQLNAARVRLQRRLCREPEPRELAQELGVSLERLGRWLSAASTEKPLPLEAEESPLVSQLPDPATPPPDLSLEEAERVAHVRRAIAALPPRERKILVARYVEGKPWAEIASEAGVTRTRVNQLASRGLRRLRESRDILVLAA